MKQHTHMLPLQLKEYSEKAHHRFCQETPIRLPRPTPNTSNFLKPFISVQAWGAWGRKFESCRPDHLEKNLNESWGFFVAVTQ